MPAYGNNRSTRWVGALLGMCSSYHFLPHQSHEFLHLPLHLFHALPHTQLLSALRARWYLQLRSSVNCRDINLRPQSRFGNRNRHRDVNVVTLATKYRVRFDAHNYVEIAGRAAPSSRITFAPETDS